MYSEVLLKRRSVYHLGKNLNISQDAITELISSAVKHSPTAFNAQPVRVIIAYDDAHNFIWDSVHNILKEIVPVDSFASTTERIQGFKNAYATILFYLDDEVIKETQDKFALYQERIPTWGEHDNAIAQFSVWMSLAEHNIGANLQHYNPLADEALNEHFNVPASWRLIAQLPFGSIESEATEKAFINQEETILTFNK